MAAITDITTGIQTDTATGAITGTIDGDGFVGDYTVGVTFTLSGANTARVALQDTADDFTAAIDLVVWDIKGPTSAEGITHHVRSYDVPSARFGAGTDGTGLRFNVLAISGGSLTTHGWLDGPAS